MAKIDADQGPRTWPRRRHGAMMTQRRRMRFGRRLLEGHMTRVSLNVLAIAAVATMILPTNAGAQTDSAPAAASAPAPDAAAKPKPKRRPVVSVTVTNERKVGLKELDAAGAGGPKTKKVVANLAPGGKAVVKLGKGKDCLYDFHAIYDDGQSADIAAIDVCKDKSLNLVE